MNLGIAGIERAELGLSEKELGFGGYTHFWGYAREGPKSDGTGPCFFCVFPKRKKKTWTSAGNEFLCACARSRELPPYNVVNGNIFGMHETNAVALRSGTEIIHLPYTDLIAKI